MIELPKPLLQRRFLAAGESLRGLTVRLVDANDYDSPLAIDSLVRNKFLKPIGKRERVDCPRHPETYEVLTALTLLNATELYSATAHRFACIFTPPDFKVDTVTLPGGETVPMLG